MSNKGNYDFIKSLFLLLSKGSGLITDAYNNGFIEDDFGNPRLIEELKLKRILFTTDNGRIRLQPKLQNLINYVQEDEKTRHINTSFGDHFEELKILADRYLVEKNKDANESERIFLEVESIVYEVTEDAKEASSRLRRKINDRFGYVKSLADKKIENDRAITVAERLIVNLRVFSFERMREMAQSNARLYPLLCNTLVGTITNCYEELQLTLEQLKTLITTYRTYEQKNALVSGFLGYWKVRPEYQIENYSDETVIPSIFNMVCPLMLSAHADLENDRNEQDLLKLIEKSKVREICDVPLSSRKDPAVLAQDDHRVRNHIIKVDPLSLATDKMLASVIRGSKKVSALEFYKEQDLDCPKMVWLFYLAAKLSMMNEGIKNRFEINYSSQPYSCASGTNTLMDIEICCFEI